MLISVPLLTTGIVIGGGSWGVKKFRDKRKPPPTLVQKLSKNKLKLPAPARPSPKKQVESLLKQVDDRYQAVIHNTIDRLFGEHYEKHMQALGGTTGVDGIPPLEKQRNRQAGYATVSFALVLTGQPLLVAGSFAINLYLGLVAIQIGLEDMWQKRTLTARGLRMIVYLGMMTGGFLAVQSAALMADFLVEKLISTVQGHSHERLVNVFGELPQTVSCLENGVIVSRPLEEVQAGNIVMVHAGEVIPVDGQIMAGYASIDQHALTGEAQPKEMSKGDTVLASTLVLMGEIQVQVTTTDTLAAQITDLLNHTRNHHTQVALRGIEIADNTVYAKVALGLLVLPIHGINSMLTVWAIHLGTFLMGTTPLTLMAYLDIAAQSNIFVKDGRSLELLSSIDTVVFDKTGTLTQEQPTVCGLHRCGDLSEEELLALAAAMEERQSHPIAAAIRDAAAAQHLALPLVNETRVEMGYGLTVTLDDQRVLLGSQRYMTASKVTIPNEMLKLAHERQAMGHSIVYLAVDGVLEGMIELQPTVRPEAQALVNALHERGIEISMITGDQEAPAQALAKRLGIDRVFANVLPQQKAELVSELQAQGRRVMFVGDGINDSIALKQANVSVSIMGATTIATDTAQIVLMDGTLEQLDTLFDLAERYEGDLGVQYVLAVHLPAAYLGGTLLFGWGLVSAYVAGNLLFLAAMGLALRPIWRQEQLLTQLSLTEPDNT